MKKALCTIGMIAILFGFAFTGMAASGNPNLNTIDAKITALQGDVSTIKANVNTIKDSLSTILRMETFSGSESVSQNLPNSAVLFSRNYDQIRHISLTIYYQGVDHQYDEIMITASVNGNWIPIKAYFSPYSLGYEHIEFDTDSWKISGTDAEYDPIKIWVNETSTYVQSP